MIVTSKWPGVVLALLTGTAALAWTSHSPSPPSTFHTTNLQVDSQSNLRGLVSICPSGTPGCSPGEESFVINTSGSNHVQVSELPSVHNGFTVLRHDHMTGSNNPGILQLQESIVDGTLDTGSGDNFAVAAEFDSLATQGTGSGVCSNIGALLNATGCPTNYAILSNYGDIRMNIANSATLGLTNVASLVSTGDLTVISPGAVSLGQNVGNFELPGTPLVTPQIRLGTAVANGYGIIVKNTVAGQVDGGYTAALDTTVDANVRGGFVIERGAGGGIGANDSGIVKSSGVGFITSSDPNDLLIVNQDAHKRIILSSDGTGFTAGAWLNENGVWSAKVLGTGSENGPKWQSGAGVPGLACNVGDLYSNTTGGVGTTFYVCEATNTWIPK